MGVISITWSSATVTTVTGELSPPHIQPTSPYLSPSLLQFFFHPLFFFYQLFLFFFQLQLILLSVLCSLFVFKSDFTCALQVMIRVMEYSAYVYALINIIHGFDKCGKTLVSYVSRLFIVCHVHYLQLM